MVTGPMPRNPKATNPKAKIGPANANFAGIIAINALWVENCQAKNINTMMISPIQNAEKLPATKPERIFSEAPPCFEQLVTSFTWADLVLTNILVNSGMSAPATVPQLMIPDNTHHNAGWATPLASTKSPRSSLLAMNVMAIDTAEVIHTK